MTCLSSSLARQSCCGSWHWILVRLSSVKAAALTDLWPCRLVDHSTRSQASVSGMIGRSHFAEAADSHPFCLTEEPLTWAGG
jgi:hypothetical protein